MKLHGIVSKFQRAFLFGLLCLVGSRMGLSQYMPEASGYEVAVIKPSPASDQPPSYRWTQDRFSARNQSIRQLIKTAFEIRMEQQIVGLPRWADKARYDIDAKITSTQVEALSKLPLAERLHKYKLLLQALLEKRFALKIEYEDRELPIYLVVLAKSGPTFKEVEGIRPVDGDLPPPPPPGTSLPPRVQMPRVTVTRGHFEGVAIPMSTLTSWIANQPETSDRVVQDGTTLKGTYNLAVHFAPDDIAISASNRVESDNGSEPSLLAALREQLGLQLVRTKANVPVLVVDRVEKPSPD